MSWVVATKSGFEMREMLSRKCLGYFQFQPRWKYVVCAFYQKTDWPTEILISIQNLVCNKCKFTCNNLGGWIRFVFCMFPENQDNFTLNSKSIIYSRHNIVRKGHISTTFQSTFIAGSSQMASTVSLHSQRRACKIIVSSNSVTNDPMIFFHQMIRWFFHQMIRWFLLQHKRPDLLLWTCSASWGDPQCCSVPDLEASAPPQATAGKIIICR